MKNRLVLMAVFVLFGTQANACLNTYDMHIRGLMLKPDAEDLNKRLGELERQLKATPTLEVTNDLAVAHVLAGHHQQAIDLLKELEKKHPGHAKTAANLGTALELSGNDREAVQWIKEGIQRDSTEHEGTEWLHVKILEAKLAIAKDPSWLKTHTVLGIDFGMAPHPNASAPVTDHLGNDLSFADAAKAIEYQLKERLKFVSIPDPLIGDLYFAWGNLEASPAPLMAIDYFDAALMFGANNSSMIETRKKQYILDHPHYYADDSGWYIPWMLMAVVIGATALNGYFFYRRRKP